MALDGNNPNGTTGTEGSVSNRDTPTAPPKKPETYALFDDPMYIGHQGLKPVAVWCAAACLACGTQEVLTALISETHDDVQARKPTFKQYISLVAIVRSNS